MTASSSQITLVNRALLGVVARAQVSSINPSDGSTEADAASLLYQPTFEQLARAARWNCLRKQATLTLLAAAVGTPENPTGIAVPGPFSPAFSAAFGSGLVPVPPSPWLYAYQVPPDSLAIRFIVPSLPSSTGGTPPLTTASISAAPQLPNSGMIPFQVALSADSHGNPIEVILTNQSQAQAVYTANQPIPTTWDSMFEQAFVSGLSVFLALPVSGNLQLAQMAMSTAESYIAKARAADGNETVVTQDHVPDWILARAGAAGFGVGYGGGNGPLLIAPYIDVAWPVLG